MKARFTGAICWFLCVVFGTIALVEGLDALDRHVSTMERSGATVGFTLFGVAAMLCAMLAITGALLRRRARNWTT